MKGKSDHKDSKPQTKNFVISQRQNLPSDELSSMRDFLKEIPPSNPIEKIIDSK